MWEGVEESCAAVWGKVVFWRGGEKIRGNQQGRFVSCAGANEKIGAVKGHLGKIDIVWCVISDFWRCLFLAARENLRMLRRELFP